MIELVYYCAVAFLFSSSYPLYMLLFSYLFDSIFSISSPRLRVAHGVPSSGFFDS